tara:strand:- start:284 stop:1198 length:915 start_codon:yes stop_codon:yes gene_type:complete
MKKIICIFILILPLLSSGQQLPLYSQYMLNDFAINPALAGSKSYSPLRLNVRNQWAGLGASAPLTNTLSFHAPLRDGQFGLGGTVFQEKTGPYSQFGLMFSYAYHIKLSNSNSTRLSLGASAMLTQHSLNQDELEFKNPDPGFESGVVSSLAPDASFGAMLQSPSYYIGGAIHQLFETTFREASSNIFGDNDQVRHYILNGGFKYFISNDVFLEPSFFIKTIEGGPVQLDVNARLVLDKFWTGVSLRTSKSVVALVGLEIGKLQFGYGFDLTLSSIGSYTSGSHEISLGFNIPQMRNRRHTYYW